MPEKLPIDPALRRFLDDQAALSAGPATTPEESRARMVHQLEGRAVPGLPNGVSTADHRIVGPAGTTLPVRVYTPPPPVPARLPVLVYLHGGGWVAGSVATHDPFCRLLCRLAAVSIVSVEYRLAPEHPFPAAIEDAEAAVRWAAAEAASWGGDAQLLALGGDSAGGNLAVVTAGRLLVTRGAPALRALALLYPVTDHPSSHHASYAENATGFGLEASGMRWYWEQYAARVSPDDPEIAPLRATHLPALPPTLITTAQYDVLRDEGTVFARRLAAAGVVVRHLHAPDMHHNFPVGPSTVARFPQSDRALGQIAAWLRHALAPA